MFTIQYWTEKREPRYTLEQLMLFSDTHRMSVIAAVNAHFPIAEQVKALEEQSLFISGVKLYTGYQHFYPDDELVRPVAEFCLHHGKPLMFHCGCCSRRGKPLMKYADPNHIDELATRFPQLRIIIAHFGFPHILDAAAIIDAHDHVYADISGTIDRLDAPELTRRLTDQYCADLTRALNYFPKIVDKVLFGTDYSGEKTHLNEIDPYIETVERVFGDQADNVFHKNADRLFSD